MSAFKLDDVSLSRTGRVVLCTVVSLAAAIWVMSSFAQGNIKPLLYSCMGGAGLLVWFAFDRFFWPVAIATLFLGGRFSFLPADLSLFQVAMAFGITRFLVDFVAFRKVKLQRGPALDQILMAVFFGIFFWHAWDEKLALRVLGSELWGGRSYVTISFAFMTYVILQTVPYDRDAWRRLPFFALVPVTFDLCVQLIAVTAPGLAFRLGQFYTGFLTQSVLAGGADEAQRSGAWSGLGLLISISIFSFVRLETIWRPEKWWALCVATFGFLLNVIAGYRSAILGWLMVIMTAAVRDLRKASLMLVPLLAVTLMSLVLLQSIVPLPRSIQRGLTFLPGSWDSTVTFDATASLNFRRIIREQWWDKHFPNHPLFGRGFGFDPIWGNYDDRNQDYDFYESIIQVGNFHNFKIAVLDAVGMIGMISMSIWSFIVLRRVLTVLWTVPFSAQPAIVRWLSLYLVWLIVSNWIPLGGTSVSNMLEPFLVLGSLFLRVAGAEGLLPSTSGSLAERYTADASGTPR